MSDFSREQINILTSIVERVVEANNRSLERSFESKLEASNRSLERSVVKGVSGLVDRSIESEGRDIRDFIERKLKT
ncbi:MAG: hypothetical protein WAZ14_01665 [Patescibacteria group bacterium]